MTKIRGALVTTIYKKMLTIRAETTNSSSAVSLMSTDVDRITLTTFMCVKLAPDVVQLIVALCILGTELGATTVAPVILCLICIGVAAHLGKLVPPRQRRWMAAIQKRVGITSDIIGAMKGVKVAGLSEKVDKQIHGLRDFELDRSVAFRKMQISTQLLGKRIRLTACHPPSQVLTESRHGADSSDARRYIHGLCHCAESVGWDAVQHCTGIHRFELVEHPGRAGNGHDHSLDELVLGARLPGPNSSLPAEGEPGRLQATDDALEQRLVHHEKIGCQTL